MATALPSYIFLAQVDWFGLVWFFWLVGRWYNVEREKIGRKKEKKLKLNMNIYIGVGAPGSGELVFFLVFFLL